MESQLTYVFILSACFIFLLPPFITAQDDYEADDDPNNLLYTTNTAEFEDFPLNFENELPKWLKGTLIRNGVGRFEVGKRRMLHLFDGFAKLSSWKFNGNGNATFSTKFIRSDFYKESISSNDIAPYLNFMGVEPPYGYFERMKLFINNFENMNVNVYPYYKDDANQFGYYALTDYWKMYEFNASNLETFELISPKIPGGGFEFASFASTAHPVQEPGKNSTLVHLGKAGLFPWESNTLNLVRIHATNKREIVASIPVKELRYMHSFAASENYAIFFVNPVYGDLSKLLKTTQILSTMDWHGDEPTQVKVINLKTGEVTHLETNATMVFHHGNAYEQGNDTIYVDLISYADGSAVHEITLENFRDSEKRKKLPFNSELVRYQIDLKEKRVVPMTFKYEPGFPRHFDFPKINDAYHGKHYCFLYGAAGKLGNFPVEVHALVKKDVCEKGRDLAYVNLDQHMSEPVFVARPNSKGEDDGILLSPILDTTTRKSYLYILDAKSMAVINRAELPTVVPYNFHGSFFPEIY